MTRTFAKRAGAVIGALALGAVAVFGSAVPASAVPGNIDESIPRTLTIHKYQLAPNSPQAPGTGQLIPGGVPGGIPLEGAEFTVREITSVDITTPAGWTQAGQLNANIPAAAALADGTPTVVTTNAAGIATFSGLDVGLYYVAETATPGDVTDPVAPFLVSLPFPTGQFGTPANDWIYDVHVYPKNSVSDLTKNRVAPAPGSVEARNPDLVRWAISSTIPTLPAGTPLSQFSLTDELAPELTFVATPPAGVAPTSVTATTAAGGNLALVASDYTITTAGTTQTVAFTPAGRTKLQANGGGSVTFTVLTRAVDVPANGLIVNTASSIVNGATETVTGTTPIGELTVFAYAAPPVAGGSQQTPLAGAVFQLFLTEADANAGTNPVSIGGVSQWTSGPDGQINIPALVPGTYFVREITPPAGFQIPTPAIQSVGVVAGPTSVSAPVQNYLTVPHVQVPAWQLPLTGGDGALWFGVGGGALLLIVVGAAIVVARRRAAEATAPVA